MVNAAIGQFNFAAYTIPAQPGREAVRIEVALPSALVGVTQDVLARCPADFDGGARPRDVDYAMRELDLNELEQAAVVQLIARQRSETARLRKDK